MKLEPGSSQMWCVCGRRGVEHLLYALVGCVLRSTMTDVLVREERLEPPRDLSWYAFRGAIGTVAFAAREWPVDGFARASHELKLLRAVAPLGWTIDDAAEIPAFADFAAEIWQLDAATADYLYVSCVSAGSDIRWLDEEGLRLPCAAREAPDVGRVPEARSEMECHR